MDSAEKFRQKLGAVGNIVSDGRPILGLDSRNLLEIALESGEGMELIPAHIWTPWFSVLGSKSGFDSIEDCYGDLAGHIFAVETGLSSDPEMNWKVSKLDKYRLVSNSDAHSPAKLAREATVFDAPLDYHGIMNALKTGEGYTGTVEFFPEEGKYHEDGHRKCNVCLTPEESGKLNNICPVCGKPLTIGVLNRVCELADRPFNSDFRPQTAGKVFSLVPLAEILSEIMQVGTASKSVTLEYDKLIHQFGSELSILQDVPADEISKSSPLLGEGISRLRAGKVIKQAGYDGEYGIIRLFDKEELVQKKYMNLKLNIDIPKTEIKKKTFEPVSTEAPLKQEEHKTGKTGLDEFQKKAVESESKKLLITAGPGSGKTTVLTRRIAYMVKEKGIASENCLAITLKENEPLDAQIKQAEGIEEYIERFLTETAKRCKTKNEFIHEVSLLRESDALDSRADRIPLMTLHASKGLEFKCVFIAGLENGIIPLYRAVTLEEIEEERRLLYVGMTRAKQRLFLSRALKRNWMGTLKNLEISPFLAKIEEDLLTRSKFESVHKDNSKQLSLF